MRRASFQGSLDADDPGPGPWLGISATHNARHAVVKSRRPKAAGASVTKNSILVSSMQACAIPAKGQTSSLPSRHGQKGRGNPWAVCPLPFPRFLLQPVDELCWQPG